jgi:hypothetical protein
MLFCGILSFGFGGGTGQVGQTTYCRCFPYHYEEVRFDTEVDGKLLWKGVISCLLLSNIPSLHNPHVPVSPGQSTGSSLCV